MPGFGFAPATAFGNRAATRAIGEIPSLTLAFSALDPRLEFSRASPGTYTDGAGLIALAASGAPRFDHDPASLAPLGLLIEQQRTNLAFPSIPASVQDKWPTGSSTIALAASAGPDGLDGLAAFHETMAAGGHGIYEPSSPAVVLAGADYAASAYVKSIGRTKARLTLGNTGVASGAYAEFDLSSRAVHTSPTAFGAGAAVAGSARVRDAGNALRRISLAGSLPTTSGLVIVNSLDATGAYAFAGDTSAGLGFGYAQIEAGSFATSYIPATRSAATRADDACSTTHADFTGWLAQPEKTLVVAADSPASGTRRVFHAAKTGNESSDYVSIWTNGTTAMATVVAGGVTQADLALGPVSAGVPFKVALSLAAGAVQASLDGAAKVTGTAATIPVCDKAWLGCGPAGEQLCGHLAGTWRFIDRIGDVAALAA